MKQWWKDWSYFVIWAMVIAAILSVGIKYQSRQQKSLNRVADAIERLAECE